MRIIISNLLNLDVQNVSVEIFWILGIVYGVLLLVTVSSILKSVDSLIGRLAWLLLTVGFPLGGMVLYCLRCILVADFSSLSQFTPKKKQAGALKV